MSQVPEHQLVECPKCWAGKDEPCRTLDGQVADKVHFGRPRRSAITASAEANYAKQQSYQYQRSPFIQSETRLSAQGPEYHLTFDLETHDSALLYSMGPEFFRIGAYSCKYSETDQPPVRVTGDPYEIRRVIEGAATATGHNNMPFDNIVMARHFGLDHMKLARQGRLRDTMLTAFLDDPPPARMNAGQIDKYYSLDQVADRVVGKRKAVDVSKALVKEYGSWGGIARGDRRFHLYADIDVTRSGEVADALCEPGRRLWPYAEREHLIAAVCAQITMNGFRVDEPEVRRRVAAGEQKRSEIIAQLVEEHGLPTTCKDGSPSKAPQNTQEGRAAIKRAFEKIGAEHMPKTDKGAWATGREAMDKMKEHYGTDVGKLSPQQQREIRELADTIQSLNGIRTVYETTANNMVQDSDGGWRVHPQIALRQASGRLSFSKPGLTVMGKRSGRHHEREIFIPDPGEVIVTADLAQVDARAVAVLSQDPEYMKMFDPGRDLHSEISKRVFGTEKMREQAKVAGHGYNYGMGIDGMVKQLGIDHKVAAQFARQMREQFPRLVEWKQEQAEIAAAGHLLDNGFGRKMRPDKMRAHTQGPALMGQGCARDILCEGILRLIERYPETLPMLRGIIHDEVVLSVPIDDADDVESAVIECLSFEWAPATMPHARPIRIEAGSDKRGFKSWGECYDK